MNDFLHTALDAALQPAQAIEPKDVVLYGFGRIGRLLARLLIEKSGAGYPLRLRAIVVRGGKRAILKTCQSTPSRLGSWSIQRQYYYR